MLPRQHTSNHGGGNFHPAIELLGSLEDDLFLNVLFDSVFTP
jgi:hypothetical protein